MVELIVLFVLIAAVAVVASRFGADSRDGDDWYIHHPA